MNQSTVTVLHNFAYFKIQNAVARDISIKVPSLAHFSATLYTIYAIPNFALFSGFWLYINICEKFQTDCLKTLGGVDYTNLLPGKPYWSLTWKLSKSKML